MIRAWLENFFAVEEMLTTPHNFAELIPFAFA